MKIENVLDGRLRMRILKLLVKYKELNITEIVRSCEINNRIVRRHVTGLVNMEILNEKKFGRIKIYSLKMDNPLTQQIVWFFNNWNENPDIQRDDVNEKTLRQHLLSYCENTCSFHEHVTSCKKCRVTSWLQDMG